MASAKQKQLKKQQKGKDYKTFLIWIECECGKTIFIQRVGKNKIIGTLK